MRLTRTLLIAVFCLSLFGLGISASWAAPNDDTYKVRVAKGLKKDAAESLRNELKKEGYLPVELNDSGGGVFTVLVGAARSKEEAQTLVKDLKQAGFTPEDVEEPSTGGSTAAGAALPGVDTSLPGSTAYRVLVHEFKAPDQADDGKQSLKNEGFTNVDVVAEDGKYKLYVSTFNKKSDAEALLGQLRNAGFATAQVVSVERKVDTKAVAAAPPALSTLPANLTANQKVDAQAMLDKAKRANSGEMTGAEYLEFQKELQRQGNDIKQLIAVYEKQRGEQTEMQGRIWSLYREFDANVEAKRYDAARRKLDEVRTINANDSQLAAKQQRLDKLMAGGTGAPGAGAATAAAASNTGATKPAGGQKVDQAQVVQALAQARKTELTANNPNLALAEYNKVLQLDPTNVEARGKVAELNEKISQPAAAPGMTQNQKLMYAGIGGLVLVIVLLAYWQFVNARREKKLEAQVRELTQHGVSVAPAASPTASASVSPLDTFVDPLAPGGMYDAASAPAGGGMSGIATAPASATSGSSLFGGGMEMPGMGGMIGNPEVEHEETPSPSSTPAAQTLEEVEEVSANSDVVSLSSLNFDGLGMEEESHEEVSKTETPVPSVPPPGSDSLSLGDLDLGFGTPTPPPSVGAPEPAAAGSPSMSMPDLDLDALLKGTFPGVAAPEASKPSARIEDITPAKLPDLNELSLPSEEKSIHDEVTMRDLNASAFAAMGGGLGTAPTVHIPTPFPAGVGTPSAGSANITPPGVSSQTAGESTGGGSRGVHFEQSFDEEAVGSQPAGWKGDYDYASLTVDESNAAQGHGRCLKFEKRSGAGSASYHCNFPNASGQVTVEFDIRCDDKNKYLLGFYVEKDEDFKQSVHTIVHRIDSRSQPSLRIQGEPVPYELSTWRHVKYELNLLIGVVNAFVDEQHVVKDAKLPTIPAYVNTLSIRDNLATTGLLYLDNIRITQR